jgi:Glycosyl hydrolase family 1
MDAYFSRASPHSCTFVASAGDSSLEPFRCVRNVLLAHAAAVKQFRKRVRGGKISMNLDGDWSEPYDPSSAADKVGDANR